MFPLANLKKVLSYPCLINCLCGMLLVSLMVVVMWRGCHIWHYATLTRMQVYENC